MYQIDFNLNRFNDSTQKCKQVGKLYDKKSQKQKNLKYIRIELRDTGERFSHI